MWLTLTAVLALGADPSAEAEGMFKKMEEAVFKAKTVQSEIEVKVEADQKPMLDMKGRFLVETGNRARLELSGEMKGRKEKIKAISDGKRQTMIRGEKDHLDPDSTRAALEDVGETVLLSLSRTGVPPAETVRLDDPSQDAIRGHRNLHEVDAGRKD